MVSLEIMSQVTATASGRAYMTTGSSKPSMILVTCLKKKAMKKMCVVVKLMLLAGSKAMME